MISTPEGKNILVDTGEEENVVVEYLLDRKIKKIDYLMISHFDSDHCKNSVQIIEKLDVKNIIISKQAEKSTEFENIIYAVKKRKVNIMQVKAGDKIIIDKNTYFQILWPDENNIIKENALNNNSIVAKMYYKDFSILFTGDIEEIAEKEILEKYKNNLKLLKSTAIKIAHHGSRTSSTKEFIEAISPQFALIGVGQENKFGHPSEETIEKLHNIKCRIYRTDKQGEIIININKKKIIKVETHIKH